LVIFCICTGVISLSVIAWDRFSVAGRQRRKQRKFVSEIPKDLVGPSDGSIYVGEDLSLNTRVFLPDSVRSRHVHILGATGSGKTESVILNFLKQDVSRGLGSIILDAKGDTAFLTALHAWVPKNKLKIFDLGSSSSLSYDPLAAGTPLESAQRLFSSLVWSEQYYESKALSALQRIFQSHHQTFGGNPTLRDLSKYLESPEAFIAVTISETYPKTLADREFTELSGLRDQIRSLCTGHLEKILSPRRHSSIQFQRAKKGDVIYFRLQSLMSPQLVSTVGKLLINNLSYVAGKAHRSGRTRNSKIVPVFLDEFASFACPEFADLVSKARSAGYALHFSHQSMGDLKEVSEGFIDQITGNSATKIVLRINDPDSAEYFARTFGTKIYQKITQRITNTKNHDRAEVVGEGSQREAHQFRAAPDLFKTLPTGVGSVLIAHGIDTPHGASTVFKIKFPKLERSAK
jgi:type IV secretory pathway TraG/TraD family ATPase VirD4